MIRRRGRGVSTAALRAFGPSVGRRVARGAMAMVPYAAGRLARAVPYVGAALNAYDAARTVSKMFRSKKRKQSSAVKTVQKKKKNRYFENNSTGVYAGRFRKMSKKGPKLETYLMRKGVHFTQETYGDVVDDHAAYMVHSTYYKDLYINAIMGCLIRKLLEKHGITVGSLDNEIPFISPSNSGGFKFQYVHVNAVTNVYTTVDYIVLDNDNISGVISNFAGMRSHINALLTRMDPGFNQEIPYSLALYSHNPNLEDSRLEAFLDLQNETIALYAQSTITIQNRTKGAGATGSESDRVDNQPLTGLSYEFRGADPKLRKTIIQQVPGITNGPNHYLARIRADGLNLVPAGTMDNDYWEPPVPKHFANVLKSSKVLLQPGSIKKSTISWKIKFKLPKLLDRLAATQQSFLGGVQVLTGVPGKSQMFCFEEAIHTASANKVTLQYERDIKVGAVAKTSKPAPLATKYTYGTYSAA